MAVAFGVLILCSFTAVFNALVHQGRYGDWQTAMFQQLSGTIDDKNHSAVDPLYVAIGSGGNLEQWGDEPILVATLYAGGPKAPSLNGLATPSSGSYYVSPRLDGIMHEHPHDALGQRFGERQAGIIPNDMLMSPDALVVIRGATEAEKGSLQPIYSLQANTTASKMKNLIMSTLYLGIFILLFPVILLVSIAAKLGSAQREQRYAALRLVGATKRQITRIVATESIVAAVAGIVIGIVFYFALQPLLTEFRFNGMRFWPHDISLEPWQYLTIIASTLLLVWYANWWGMRHVQTSPLGVARRQRVTKNPRVWRVIPLLVGVGIVVEIRMSMLANEAKSSDVQWVILGVMLIMLGLVWAGPWLTYVISTRASKHAQHAHTLLGSRYIAMHTREVFRSVSGVVVALFAGSFYLTAVSGIPDLYAKTLANNGYAQFRSGTAVIESDTLPSNFATILTQQPYIHSVQPVSFYADTVMIIPCASVATYTSSSCPAGSAVMGVNLAGPVDSKKFVGNSEDDVLSQIKKANPAIAPDTTPKHQYVVSLDDSAIDRLRTLVAQNGGPLLRNSALVTSGTQAHTPFINPIIKNLADLTYAGMAVTMVVAIVGMTVSTVGGLLERRRSLFTLRLGGMQIREMRRMVLIESLIPLVATSLFAAGLGVGVGYLFMQMVSTTLDAAISPIYFAVVAGSLIAASGVMYMILPLIQKITTLEANRSE